MNKFSSSTEEPLTRLCIGESKAINPERDIKYIIKVKRYNDGYCYVVVFNPEYCDVTCDNTRLLNAYDLSMLYGPNGEYRDVIDSKIIYPSLP